MADIRQSRPDAGLDFQVKVLKTVQEHEHLPPMRKITRHERALARNYPEGWKLQGHVSPENEEGTFFARKRSFVTLTPRGA